MTATKYFGKYRGLVVNNVDPNRMGRLQVSCPHVLGENVLSWAMPCMPFAGPMEGFYTLPLIGSNVWVEFEAGNPDHPIWAGCFWTQQTIPPKALMPFVRTFKSTSCEVTLDDTPGAGGITLQALPPAVGVPTTITMDATGIKITVGAASIALDPARISLNNGALEVI